MRDLLIDPDCRDGKCGSCMGDPCEHISHTAKQLLGLRVTVTYKTGDTITGRIAEVGSTNLRISHAEDHPHGNGNDLFWPDLDHIASLALIGRPSTPDRKYPGGTTITVKRMCDGCGNDLGDITATEINAAVAGRPVPDVTDECPTCSPDTWQAALIAKTAEARDAAEKAARTVTLDKDQLTVLARHIHRVYHLLGWSWSSDEPSAANGANGIFDALYRQIGDMQPGQQDECGGHLLLNWVAGDNPTQELQVLARLGSIWLEVGSDLIRPTKTAAVNGTLERIGGYIDQWLDGELAPHDALNAIHEQVGDR